ncbi:hypothetical protein DFQ26_005541 [Actinomortierella ambigua]|nr:hypothetical protein DFQ26_005541 [Actinomortierella ambigua]
MQQILAASQGQPRQQVVAGSSPTSSSAASPYPNVAGQQGPPSVAGAGAIAATPGFVARGVPPPLQPQQPQQPQQQQYSPRPLMMAGAGAGAGTQFPTAATGPLSSSSSSISSSSSSMPPLVPFTTPASASSSLTTPTAIKMETPTTASTGGTTPLGVHSSAGGSTPGVGGGVGGSLETPRSGQISVTSYDQTGGTGRGGGPTMGEASPATAAAAAAPSPAASQIFKATYSGVPVFEMICKGVAVMRRRSDSYLNATQILKVAEFDKPQRTRILEREVQKGEHEKVQGGYGKYQGTWVPFDRGLQLCQEYNVMHLLKPLLEYEMKSSPPLAPKHITAATNRPRKPREPRVTGDGAAAGGGAAGGKVKKERAKKSAAQQILPKPGAAAAAAGAGGGGTGGGTGRGGVYQQAPMTGGGESGAEIGSAQYLDDFDDSTSSASDMEDDGDVHSMMMSDNASVDDTMSVISAQSRTPSPLESRHDMSSSDMSEGESQGRGGSGGRRGRGRSGSAYSRRRQRSRSTEQHSPMTRKRYARPGDELFVGYQGLQRHHHHPHHHHHHLNNNLQGDVEMESRDGEEMRSHRLSRDPSPRGRSRSRTRATEEQGALGEWQDGGGAGTGAGAGGDATSAALAAAAAAAASGEGGSQAQGEGGGSGGNRTGGRYAQTLLNYFISDSQALPKILTHPPADLDFDVIIDEEGHTPLHWAVAMARTKIVRLLVQHGADIYRVNNQGQTALMRSVLFTNNFDLKTFPTLLEILQKTIFTIDKNDQTVFHHVAATAGMRGKVHASRYYMECLLEKLANHPTELATIINVRDVVGDTALTIAARIGNKKVVRLLMEAGADPKIRNKSGKNAEDYLAEHDQFPQLQQQQQLQGGGGSGQPSSSMGGQRQDALALKAAAAAVAAGQRPIGLSPPSYAPPPHLQIQQQQQQPSPQSSQHLSHRPDSASPQMARQYGVDPSSSRGGGGYGGPGGSGSMGMGMGMTQQQLMQQMQQQRLQTGPMNPFQVGHPPPHHPPMGHGPSAAGGVSTLYKSLREANSWPAHLGVETSASVSASSRPGSRATSVERSASGVGGVGASAAGGGTNNNNNNNNSGMRRVIPTVTDLFEQLTQSYEKDLFEREKDLVDARNMLHGIQSDIREGQRTIEELRAKTAHGVQTEEQIRTLEGMVRQEMNMRQRLRLEELVAEEEAKLARVYAQRREADEAVAGAAAGGGEVERCEQLEREAREAQQELGMLQKQRNEQLDAIVKLKSQQGKRRHEYKRLIALCCNVSIDEVDGLLGPMLSALGSDDMVLE